MLFFNEERLHFPNNHCRCFRSTRTHRGDLQSGFETFTVLIFTARPHAHTEGRVLSRGHFTFSRASLLLLWTTSPPDSLPWNAEVLVLALETSEGGDGRMGQPGLGSARPQASLPLLLLLLLLLSCPAAAPFPLVKPPRSPPATQRVTKAQPLDSEMPLDIDQVGDATPCLFMHFVTQPFLCWPSSYADWRV